MELKPVYLFIVAFIVITLGIVTLQTSSSNIEQIDTTNHLGSSNFTYTTPTTLTSEEGITSNSIQFSNGALYFDGVDDYVNVSNISNLDLSKDFTIALWFKTNKLTGNFDNKQLLWSDDLDSSNKVHRLELDGDGNLTYFYINSSGVTVGVNTESTPIKINNWYSLVLTSNRETNRTYIYINNSLVLNFTLNGYNIVGTNREFILGEYRKSSNPLNGSADNVIILQKYIYPYEVNAIGKSINFNYKNGIKQQNVTRAKLIYINESNIPYAYTSSGVIAKSSDNGTTWTTLYTMPVGTGSSGIFIDSRNTIFVGRDQTPEGTRLYYSIGNDTNWTYSTPFYCNVTTTSGVSNGTFWGHGMTEDISGNLYLAEYSLGGADTCSYIHKSVDGGITWNITYNATKDSNVNGRHVHFVQYNPYNGYLYAATGDYYNRSILIRSIDNGTTWQTLQFETTEDWSDNVDAQYTSITFTPEYRIIGTDAADPDKIIRTSDDINFETVLTLASDESCHLWRMRQDLQNRIYVVTVCEEANKYAGMYVSSDNGTTWTKILDTTKTVGTFKGLDDLSNFDSNNYAYYSDALNTLTYRFTPSNNLSLFYKLNSNNGTIAYDSSGNNNHGTISGATWSNDGILVSLIEGVDYTLNTATGLLTLSSDYLYSWIESSWTYNYRTTQQNYLVANITGIFIVLSILGFIFLIINYYIKEIRG